MFTYVKLNNYRSLDGVFFDLKETKDRIKKIAAIYGENGSGKTNLIRSFYFLEGLMHSFDIEKSEKKLLKILEENDDDNKFKEIFTQALKENSLNQIYHDARTIEGDGNTRLEFGFEADGHEGIYVIEFNDVIVYEKLYYYTGKQSGIIYEINGENPKNPKMSTAIFKTSKIRNEIKELISKYWGKHSLLAITFDMYNNLNKEYIYDNINPCLYSFHKMIEKTSVLLKDDKQSSIIAYSEINFLRRLDNGTIASKDEWLLKNSEKILNDFFTQTYSDIKKVFYKFYKKGEKIQYRLMFYKYINGKARVIPVEQESTGTKQILYILRSLFGAFYGQTVIIDEIDNGIHDLLLKVILDSMQGHITGQLIFTTHNTILLESLDPKSVYIINSNYDGTKEINCLSEFKIQDHNSPRLRYIKGLYGGIPLIENVDYDQIIDDLKNKQTNNQ